VAVLNLPFRDRSQPLTDPDVLRLPEALEGEDRRVADRLLVDAMADPDLATIGDLIDRIGRASPQDRRRIADQAREAAGLKSFTAIDWEAEAERGRRAAPPRRDADGRSYQVCHEPGCAAQAVNAATGSPEPVAARRWWCADHRCGHEADLEPWTPGLRYSETGALIDADDDAEAERERERSDREQERMRQRREQSQAERREQLAERREYERAREEQHRREDLSLGPPS
jgi:hypothetical protein